MTPAVVTVLWNPSAGSASSGLEAHVVALFRAAGFEPHIITLQKGEDPTATARAASADAEIVVAAGGDGTISRVAAGVIGTSAVLGVLPIGTLNHFAKDLHIPLDVEGSVATIGARHIARVDVGQVNDHVFINNSSIGIYPSIVEVRDELRRQGLHKWPAAALATFRVLRRYRGTRVTVEIEGRETRWRTPFLFVGNNQYAVEGIRLGERSRLDQARLYVYAAPRVRARELPKLLMKALLGRASQAGEFEIVTAQELRLTMAGARRVRVALDGEVATMTLPLHYRSRPGALRVILPHA